METESVGASETTGGGGGGASEAPVGMGQAAQDLADIVGNIGDLPEGTEDPEGAQQTAADATADDVLALMEGGEDGVDQAQAEGQPVEEAPAPAAAPKKPAPQTLEQLVQQQQQVTAQLAESFRGLATQLPQMIAQSNQQMMAGLMQMANMRAQEAKMAEQQAAAAAAAPKAPGPEATVEDVLRYELEKAKYDHGQKLTLQERQMQQLQQRLETFENGITRAQNTGQIRNAMDTVAADPNYWWAKHPVGQELVLSACNAMIQSGAARGFDQNLVNNVSHQIVNFMEAYADQRDRIRKARGSQGAAQQARAKQQAAAPKVPSVRGGASTPAAGGKTDRVAKIARDLGLAGGRRPARVR